MDGALAGEARSGEKSCCGARNWGSEFGRAKMWLECWTTRLWVLEKMGRRG